MMAANLDPVTELSTLGSTLSASETVQGCDGNQDSSNNSDEELGRAVTNKQWHLVHRLLKEHADIDTIKHVISAAASNRVWWLLVRLFKNRLSFCNTIYKCLCEILSLNQKSRFVSSVFKFSATKEDMKIPSNLFLCAICRDSVCSEFAKEIVFQVGNRCIPRFPKCRYDQLYLFFQNVKKYLCQELNAWDLRVFIKALKDDGREAGTYLAVLLSCQVGDWDFVNQCLKAKSPRFHAGARDVFSLAWENNALECAARVLQGTASRIWCLDLYKTGPAVRANDRVFSSHSLKSCVKQKLRNFLELCQQLKLYDAAMSICLLMKDMQELMRVWQLISQEDKTNWRWGSTQHELMKIVLEWSGWRMGIEMLGCCFQSEQALCMNVMEHCMFDSQLSDDKIPALAKPLMNLHLVKEAAFEPLKFILLHCDSPTLLQKIFSKDLHGRSLAQFHIGERNLLACVVAKIEIETESFEYLRNHSFGQRLQKFTNDLRNVRAMLRVCIETGVATYQNEFYHPPLTLHTLPMSLAVRTGLGEEAMLLYRAGATSNAEVYRLSTHSQLRSDLESWGKSELLSFVDAAASTPRSLQDLCRLSVSHYVGCRPDRKDRALSLGLPVFLLHQILLYDILYPDGQPWPGVG